MSNERYKFRAWNGSAMIKPDSDWFVRFDGGVGRDNFKTYESQSSIVSFEDFVQEEKVILMQWTGLLDKNGKEIYEGDVLIKRGPDWENYSNETYETEPAIIEIARDVATMERFPRYWLQNESFGYEGEDLEDPEEWEIIGNIHESPELLK